MHRCHFPTCPTPTAERLLFCPAHWRMVPPAVQARVWATFRDARTREARLRSRAYLTACADAVDTVATLLGATVRNSYRAVLLAQEARGVLGP